MKPIFSCFRGQKNQKQSTIVQTTVNEVQWNISRHGKVKPLLLLKPVTISGSVVKQATAHNAKFIKDKAVCTVKQET